MASFTIDQLRALPDYAQPTKWDITFLTLPAVGPFGFPVSEELNFRCASVDTPSGENQKFSVSTRGHKKFQSGIMDYGNAMELTFNETVDNTIFNLVKAWRELCWSSRQGRSFPQADLEATILVTLLDNQDAPRASWKYFGCFYENSNFGELDGETSDAIKPTLTLSFDFFVDTPLTA